ncbi:hypothetical protein [Vibrio sp. CAU 1672]|uniref:hypothetical protein n=1 Tax=Vibrio sp. CAU 1672 TaxID=3032594 RepID=UPI0023DC84C1|nr:hypothetical protein [Vibrio sp. CAU 1672]MDF2156125.1 hypothetical protein [Vibrio sp. CAU 1672]
MKYFNKDKIDFLSLLVAIVAIALSQFPPAHEWFDKEDFDIAESKFIQVQVNPFIGMTNVVPVSITNVGERYGRIKAIEMYISDSSGNITYQSEASSYLLPSLGSFEQPRWKPFTEVSLQVGENWSNSVAFSSRMAKVDEFELWDLNERIEQEKYEWSSDMRAKGIDVDSLEFEGPNFQVSDELFVEITKVIKRKISWFSVGKYDVALVFSSSSGQIIETYELNISRTNMSQIVKTMDAFQDGLEPFIVRNISLPLVPTNSPINWKAKVLSHKTL